MDVPIISHVTPPKITSFAELYVVWEEHGHDVKQFCFVDAVNEVF